MTTQTATRTSMVDVLRALGRTDRTLGDLLRRWEAGPPELLRRCWNAPPMTEETYEAIETLREALEPVDYLANALEDCTAQEDCTVIDRDLWRELGYRLSSHITLRPLNPQGPEYGDSLPLDDPRFTLDLDPLAALGAMRTRRPLLSDLRHLTPIMDGLDHTGATDSIARDLIQRYPAAADMIPNGAGADDERPTEEAPSPAEEETKPTTLTPAIRKAGESYEWACEDAPGLAPEADKYGRPRYSREQYDYIIKHGCTVYDDGDIPSWATWQRYVRTFLQHVHGPAASTRGGRATGSSVVAVADL